MEILDIKKALERRLEQITPVVKTGYEGVNFQPPVNEMYQRCQLIINPPVDPTFGTGYHREELVLQVFVCDITGKGTAGAISRAGIIRDTFAKGISLIEGQTRIYILETPQIASAFIAQDRLIVPVFIKVIAEVNS